ncbi:MAG: cytochrome ubiquinol oxidase subunit I, partial [Dehalococcoidia bacterium]|nr:cytochrome ubiquinol oxidase subunit I [Dehalococcoidia bacterium]
RIQFALTTVFHFFFVPMSVGLAIAVAIMQTLYFVKKQDVYKDMARFWGKIFVLTFAVGVVTGIIQEFQFGMNWSEYSRFVGDIFGAPLAIEALLAFFIESTFIGLWVFGWNKFSKGVHLACIWLVAIGSTLSAFWILAANSFMQQPGGYVIENGRAVLNNFAYLFTNEHVWLQFPHMWFGALMTAGCLIAGLSALKLLKNKDAAFFKKSFNLALVLIFVGGVLVSGFGHAQTQSVLKNQPMKLAAMEALYEDSEDPASLALVAGIDENNQKRSWDISLPYLLSLLSYNKTSGSVDGMNTISQQYEQEYGAGDYIPPVTTLFWSFRIMTGGAGLLLLLGLLGAFFSNRKSLERNKWYLYIMGAAIALPFVLNTAGWLITELGRYPWTVYGVFTIEQSVSPNVSAGGVLFSLIAFVTIFAVLAAVLILLIKREWCKGPYFKQGVDEQAVLIDPYGKEALNK